jgi:ketosteroid isomerase-like protein
VNASSNVELVRSIFTAWERGDYSSADWADPEIEWVIADGPSPSSGTGLAGMREVWRDAANVWTGYRNQAEEMRELDDERVLVLSHFSARGKSSGLEVGQMRAYGAHLFHVRSGKVTKIVRYWDREYGFADLGIDPETGSRVS